jgi:morphogenetic protein associated with SpoVID
VKIHIVQKGDTLWKIAKKYGVNFEELKKMNSQLSNPDMIMPGMKVKVPTTGGHVKKEGSPSHNPGHNPGIKKEMPIAEHPYAKEQPKPLPIVEAPIKEMPIKEAPKAPYVPKMPAPVIPEIDINNYYMMNMANMTVQQPPPQPVVKEVPKKEVPVVQAPPPPPAPAPAPVPVPVPAPVECPPVMEQPVCEPECVPITPIMPGPGFCPPLEFPMGAVPLPAAGPMPMMDPGMVPPAPGLMPMMDPGMVPQTPGAAPFVGGSGFVPIHFEDESSSSFMPTMPMMNPGAPGAAAFPPISVPVQPTYMQPGAGLGASVAPGHQMAPYQGFPAAEGYPAGAYQGYPEVQGGYPGYPPRPYQEGAYPQMQEGYPQGAYPQMQEGYPQGAYPQMQEGYPQGAYPQMQEGYPQGAYPQMQEGYPQGAYPQIQEGYPVGAYPGYQDLPQTGYPAGPGYPGYQGEYPRNVYQNPAMVPGFGGPGMINPYGQMPYAYPQQMGTAPHVDFESSDLYMQGAGMHQPYQVQANPLPVSTGGLADCGCGAPAPMPQPFIPTTPPVYMAPYTAPSQFAQPPFMNPYGMGPMGATPYGMPREDDENDENGN